jgi:hypothetical protein
VADRDNKTNKVVATLGSKVEELVARTKAVRHRTRKLDFNHLLVQQHRISKETKVGSLPIWRATVRNRSQLCNNSRAAKVDMEVEGEVAVEGAVTTEATKPRRMRAYILTRVEESRTLRRGCCCTCDRRQ